MMDKRRLIAIVDGLLGNGSLCNGCSYGETKGYDKYGSCDKCRRVAANEVIKIIKKKDRPTGEWELDNLIGWKCTNCGRHIVLNINEHGNFCPNCGAKMKNGDSE